MGRGRRSAARARRHRSTSLRGPPRWDASLAGSRPMPTKTAQGARVSGGQTLPIIVAVAIVVVLLAGVPLAVMRRRATAESEEAEEEGDS